MIDESKREQYYVYLDDLRESGETNMWGAAPYLRRTFYELNEDETYTILFDWMHSFNDRHPINGLFY